MTAPTINEIAPYYLYVMRVESNISDEKFLKVGISKNPFRRAYSITLNSKGAYRVTPIAIRIIHYSGENLKEQKYLARGLENQILKYVSNNRINYLPKEPFRGKSECAVFDAKDEIISTFSYQKINSPEGIFTCEEFVFVNTKYGIWKTKKWRLQSKRGITPSLEKDIIKFGEEEILMNFYLEVKKVIQSHFEFGANSLFSNTMDSGLIKDLRLKEIRLVLD